jgi:hypothetical protein
MELMCKKKKDCVCVRLNIKREKTKTIHHIKIKITVYVPFWGCLLCARKLLSSSTLPPLHIKREKEKKKKSMCHLFAATVLFSFSLIYLLVMGGVLEC